MIDPVDLEQQRRFNVFILLEGGPLMGAQAARKVQSIVMLQTYDHIYDRLHDSVLRPLFRTLHPWL